MKAVQHRAICCAEHHKCNTKKLREREGLIHLKYSKFRNDRRIALKWSTHIEQEDSKMKKAQPNY